MSIVQQQQLQSLDFGYHQQQTLLTLKKMGTPNNKTCTCKRLFYFKVWHRLWTLYSMLFKTLQDLQKPWIVFSLQL